MDQLRLYREEQKRKYDIMNKEKRFYEKYSKLIEINKYQLSAIRIQRFCKKRFFYEVENMSEYQIKDIEPIFRKRYIIQIPDETEKVFIEEMMCENMTEEQFEILVNYYQHESKKKQIKVMLDLQLYGSEPKMEINIDGEHYYLSEQQQKEIKQIWNSINPDTEAGKKFICMLQASRVLCDSLKDKVVFE